MNSPIVESDRCRCQSSSHGHGPGECTKKASADQENLCSECYQHLLSARAPALQQSDFPPRRDTRAHEAVMATWWQGTPATLLQPPKLPNVDPFYALVDRVTSEWSHLEHILDMTIWKLLDLDSNPEFPACVTSQIMGVPPRCKAIMTLARAHGLEYSDLKPFRKFMQESYELGDWRNRTIHDPWYVETGPGRASQFRAMSYSSDPRFAPSFGLQEIDKAEIEKMIEKIRTFQKLASDLSEALLNAIAALPKTIA
jgi:hypothetical protein